MTGPWLMSYIALWILFLIIVVVLISVLRNWRYAESCVTGVG